MYPFLKIKSMKESQYLLNKNNLFTKIKHIYTLNMVPFYKEIISEVVTDFYFGKNFMSMLHNY